MSLASVDAAQTSTFWRLAAGDDAARTHLDAIPSQCFAKVILATIVAGYGLLT